MKLLFVIILLILSAFIIPLLVIYLLLLYISKYHILTLQYTVKGFLTLANISFTIDHKYFFLSFHLDYFQIYLIWLKCRIKIKGLKLACNLKESKELINSVHDNKGNISGFYEAFDIKKKSDLKTKEFLNEIKEKFYKIIKEKFYNNKNKHDNNFQEKQTLSQKDKFIRNLLMMFDFLIEEVEFNFKIGNNSFYHQLLIKKGMFAALKGLNRHKEIHIISTITNLSLIEYMKVTEQRNSNVYVEYVLFDISHIYLNFKLEYGLCPLISNYNYTIQNTMNIKAEVSNTIINISTRAFNSVFTLINQLLNIVTQIQKTSINKTKKDTLLTNAFSEIKIVFECVEEQIVNKLYNLIKKLKIKFYNTKIRINTDNNSYVLSEILCSSLHFSIHNQMNCVTENNFNKLVKSNTEIKINDLLITGSSYKTIILQLPLCNFFIDKELVYYDILHKGKNIIRMNASIPKLSIILTQRDIDKYIDIIMCVLKGIKDIESKIHYNTLNQMKYLEEIIEESNLTLHMESLNLILYNNNIHCELNEKCSIEVKVSTLNPATTNNIELEINPIYINLFDKNKETNYYTSNILINGFHLQLKEEDLNKYVNISFDDSFILFYDNHLLDIMELAMDIVSSDLRYLQKMELNEEMIKVMNIKDNNDNSKIKLTFKNITLYYYSEFIDMFTLQIENSFEMIVNEYMSMSNVLIYHQNTNNNLHLNKTKIFDLSSLYIKFDICSELIEITFGKILINIYCFEVINPVIITSFFFQFFPEWLLFHSKTKYFQNKKCNYLFLKDYSKNETVKIKFDEIIININQHPIANAGIFHINYEEIKTINWKVLQNKKKEQIQIKLKHFEVQVSNTFEKDVNSGSLLIIEDIKNNVNEEIESDFVVYRFNNSKHDVISQINKTYFNKLTKVEIIDICFKEICIYHEGSQIVSVNECLINIKDITSYDKYNINQYNTNAIIYKSHFFIFSPYSSHVSKSSNVYISLSNINIILDDIIIFDKLYLLYDKTNEIIIKKLLNTDKKLYSLTDNINQGLPRENIRIDVNDFAVEVKSLDAKTGNFYNKLYININCIAVNKLNKPNNIELSLYFLTFGFDFEKNNNDYPLLILPITEFNIEDESIIRINIPNNCLQRIRNINNNGYKNYNYLKHLKSLTPLDNFIINTQSFTLFCNYAYLSTFSVLFENLRKRSKLIQTLIVKAIQNTNKTNTTVYSINENNDNNKQTPLKKVMITIFDVKIIYLINYKENYDSVFTVQSGIKEQGYFGYVIRLYSGAIKYEELYLNKNALNKFKPTSDELTVNMYLFTITSLNPSHFNDDTFFKYNKDIILYNFNNLKLISNFNQFMEIQNATYKYLLINKVLFSQFEYINEYLQNTNNYTYNELTFDMKSTLVKIFQISLKREVSLNIHEEISTKLEGLKITWNKMNMDMLNIIMFDDIIRIIDKIITDISPLLQKTVPTQNTLNDSSSQMISMVISNISASDLGRFNFVFESNDLQICIENEIKKTKILLTTNSKWYMKISKLSLNQNNKTFKLEISIKDMTLYIPPTEGNDCIYWIGDTKESKYNRDVSLFSQTVNVPNILFSIHEQILNLKETTPNIYSSIDIIVDKLIGNFASSYFNTFIGVVEVFILNRGMSLAEEKQSLDSRDEDLKSFKLDELKQKIKQQIMNYTTNYNKTKSKQISFSLGEVIMTLMKDNQGVIKLLLNDFEGDHIIYRDKSSETNVNVDNLKILDLFKQINLNEHNVILSQQLPEKIIGNYENKIEMIRFRKKDSYISIGTNAKWYVLDYLEIGIQALNVNVTMYQCDFILEFFFNTNTNITNTNNKNDNIKDNTINSINSNSNSFILNSSSVVDKNQKEYPIYFKHVKVNETKLKANFYFSEGSAWNLKDAKLKFTEFSKKDKFYSTTILLHRLIYHLKIIGIKNIGNVLASMLFIKNENDQQPSQSQIQDDESHKKLLFGSFYHK